MKNKYNVKVVFWFVLYRIFIYFGYKVLIFLIGIGLVFIVYLEVIF